MSSSQNKITLKSSDDETFEIDEAVARKFQIIANMIDDGCADKTIPLLNVKGSILSKVIEYSKTHTEIESGAIEGGEDEDEEEEEAKKTKVEIWDKEFMKGMDLNTIFAMVLAANYLNIKELLDLCCQTVADHIKDKSVEEVREIFNIENDYTPEEERAVKEENAWAFE